MSKGTSERLVVTSAMVVGGVYAYLHWQGESKLSLPEFGTAWGVSFLLLSLLATVAPGPAGGLALIIMVSDLLDNMPALNKVIGQQVPGSASSPSSATVPASETSAATPGGTDAIVKAAAGNSALGNRG